MALAVSPKSLEAVVTLWQAKIPRGAVPTPTLPVTVLVGESIDLAWVAREHWKADESRPGLEAGASSGLLSPTVVDEMLELSLALALAHTRYRSIERVPPPPVERAVFLLSEIRQGLLFAFEDEQHRKQLAQVQRLSESHNDTRSHDALALSLEGFAAYAHGHRKVLVTLPGFKAEYVDEAYNLAQRLREQSAQVIGGRASMERSSWLRTRNGLAALLSERISAVRRAARYVFRSHPHAAKLFASAYEQRKRSRRRGRRESAPVDE